MILNPVTLEETTRVWQALEMSYRLSVVYVVRVGLMDSQQQQAFQPVIEKVSEFGEQGPLT